MQNCTVLLFQDQVATGSRQRRERFIKNPWAWLELESSRIPLNRLESSGIPKNPLEPSETKLPPTDRGRLKGLAEPTFSLFYNPSTWYLLETHGAVEESLLAERLCTFFAVACICCKFFAALSMSNQLDWAQLFLTVFEALSDRMNWRLFPFHFQISSFGIASFI